MDETQVILLLAVIAVIVLSVAVIILLPKDKPAPQKYQEDEEDKKAKKKAAKQSKPRMVVPNVKVGRIKDFNEPEESNEDLLSYYSKGKNKEPSQPVVKPVEEKKKPAKQQAPAKQQNVVEDADYITIQQKAKKEKVADKAEKKDESQKKKKGFYKPEIAKEINEGRKKSKGEQAANEEVVQEQPAENKKKEKKNKPAPQKQEAAAEGEQKPQENAEGQPKFGGGRGAPIREKKPYVPGPIKNTGLDVASLEDMMNAITNYYGKEPLPPKQPRAPKGGKAAAKAAPAKEVHKARPAVPHIWNVLEHPTFVDIVALLPLKEMLRLALVDKWFQSAIKSERLWKKLCERDYGLKDKLPNVKTFKESYQKSYSKKK